MTSTPQHQLLCVCVALLGHIVYTRKPNKATYEATLRMNPTKSCECVKDFYELDCSGPFGGSITISFWLWCDPSYSFGQLNSKAHQLHIHALNASCETEPLTYKRQNKMLRLYCRRSAEYTCWT